MKDFKDYRTKYYEEVFKLMECVKTHNPHWVKERAWFVDLNTFELGENFYEKILQTEKGGRKDKNKFALLLAQAEQTMNSERLFTKAELGFAIDEDITDPEEKKEHESILGYIWWYHMYKNARDAKELGSNQKVALDKRQEDFLKIIRKIEKLSLSKATVEQ
jgi:hypothetical protein